MSGTTGKRPAYRTVYLHTFEGRVGEFQAWGGHPDLAYIANRANVIRNPALSLRQLRREQQQCIDAAMSGAPQGERSRYGYVRVRVPV